MKNLTQKKAYIILSLIILSALMLYTYFFFAKKKAYNCDEVYSYSLANSYYRPFLEQPEKWNMNYVSESSHYLGTWITGSVFHDYITVQEGERFAYGSVWHNQSQDVHPPFYYVLLHTICSFFPDTFSPWFALSINYGSFILVMLLLFKLGSKWGSPIFALIICAFYAFSGGATDTYTFLRMYALCTLWATLLFYLLYSYLTDPSIKKLFFLSIVTILSSLTHYHMIIFAFFLTLVSELYYLLKKNYKCFLQLGLTMLFSVLFAFFIFPSAITHLLFRSEDFSSLSMSPFCQFKYIINLISWQFTGISFLDIYHTMLPFYLMNILIFAIILLAIAFLLFRKEHLAQHVYAKFKRISLKIGRHCKEIIEKLPPLYFIPAVAILCLCIIFVFCLPMAYMKINSIRYLCPFYPVLIVLVFSLCKSILKVFFTKVTFWIPFSLLLLLIFTCTSNLFTVHPFLYDHNSTDGLTIKELGDESYFILLYKGEFASSMFSINLQTKAYVYSLYQSDNIESLPENLKTLPESVDKPVYLLYYNCDANENISIETSQNKAEWLNMIYQLPYVTQCTRIGTDCLSSYPVEIYQLH